MNVLPRQQMGFGIGNVWVFFPSSSSSYQRLAYVLTGGEGRMDADTHPMKTTTAHANVLLGLKQDWSLSLSLSLPRTRYGMSPFETAAAAAFPVLFGEESIRENGIMTHGTQKVPILFNGELTFSKKNCAFTNSFIFFVFFLGFFFLVNSIPHRFCYRDSYAILNMFPLRQIDKQMHNKTDFLVFFAEEEEEDQIEFSHIQDIEKERDALNFFFLMSFSHVGRR